MSESQTTRCPKCGFFSGNPDVCDACGVIFARVRSHEVEADFMGRSSLESSEDFTPAEIPVPPTSASHGKAVLSLLLIAMIGIGGWLVYQRQFRTDLLLVQRHERLIAKVRRTFEQPTLAKNAAVALEKYRKEVRNLAGQVLDLPIAANKEERLRRAALVQGNALLEETLSQDAAALHAVLQMSDPLIQVQEHLEVAKATGAIQEFAQEEEAAGTPVVRFTGDLLTKTRALLGKQKSSANLTTSSSGAERTGMESKQLERQQMIERARSNARTLLHARAEQAMASEQLAVHSVGVAAVTLTEKSFDAEVLNSQPPVLVDFWSPKFAPSQQLEPAVDELAGDYAGRARVARVQVDDSPALMRRFNITQVPTFIVFQAGKPVDRISGPVPKEAIKVLLEKNL